MAPKLVSVLPKVTPGPRCPAVSSVAIGGRFVLGFSAASVKPPRPRAVIGDLSQRSGMTQTASCYFSPTTAHRWWHNRVELLSQLGRDRLDEAGGDCAGVEQQVTAEISDVALRRSPIGAGAGW